MFSLFSLPPKKSTPNPTPLFGTQNPRQFWKKKFSVVSLGARPWSASLLLDANISVLTNEDPQANYFCCRSSQRHNPESIGSMTWIFQVKDSLQIPSVLAQPKNDLSAMALHSLFPQNTFAGLTLRPRQLQARRMSQELSARRPS